MKVLLMLDGDYVTGFAPGTMIKATPYEDQYAVEVGATGSSARTTNNNESGEIEFYLLQTSPWAKKIRELERQRATFATVCIDNNQDGDDGFTAEQSWAKRKTDFERSGKEQSTKKVVIQTNRLVFN